MRKILLRYTSAALGIIACSLLAAGCANRPVDRDETSAEQLRCRNGMKLQCFEDQGKAQTCRCVSDGEMQEMLEDLTGIRIH